MVKKTNVATNPSLLSIVQFLHHGEGIPKNVQCKMIFPWNQTNNRHYRKYMCCSGKYMENGVEKTDRLMFWGEWEPESYIIKDFGSKSFPRYLQKPLWPCVNFPTNIPCGTDPFVFNKPFIYDFCGQDHYPSLRNLAIGSLILFGFRKNSRFVVDTVFVVGDYFDYDINSLDFLQSKISEKDYLAMEQMKLFLHKKTKYRCYLGATPQNPYYGMYSFVPCRQYKFDDIVNNDLNKEKTMLQLGSNFRIQNVINPNLKQGKKKCITSDINDIKDVWNDIRKLTFDQGLLEGTRFYL